MQQATRVSKYTAFFLHGEIVESGLTVNYSWNLRINVQKITLQVDWIIQYMLKN